MRQYVEVGQQRQQLRLSISQQQGMSDLQTRNDWPKSKTMAKTLYVSSPQNRYDNDAARTALSADKVIYTANQNVARYLELVQGMVQDRDNGIIYIRGLPGLTMTCERGCNMRHTAEERHTAVCRMSQYVVRQTQQFNSGRLCRREE